MLLFRDALSNANKAAIHYAFKNNRIGRQLVELCREHSINDSNFQTG